MWQASGLTSQSLWVFPEPVLEAYGAKLNRLINEGHWWRFVTPMFLHVGLLHLLVNMYSLWIVGPYVEKLYGSAKFFVFWVVSGIAGNVASYLTVVGAGTHRSMLGRFLFKTHDFASAGASGALFGLVGVLFVFGIKYRHELPEGFKRAFGTGLLPMILLNLFIGYVGRGLIDNAAHLGGLVAGAALAVVVGYRRPGERTTVAVTWQVFRTLAMAVVVISFWKIVQNFPRNPFPVSVAAPRVRTPNPKNADFVTYIKAMNEAQEAFNEAIHGDSSGVDKAVQSLDSAPPLDEKANELKTRLKSLLLDAKKLAPPSSPAGNVSAAQSVGKLIESFVAWSRDYNQWLKVAVKDYGGMIDSDAPNK